MLVRLALVLFAGVVFAQTAGPLRFEVASVKPNPVKGQVIPIPNGQFSGINGTTYSQPRINVRDLIFDAYEVQDYQLIGLPDWAQSSAELFEVTAKVEGERVPTVPEVRQMLQSLLADRFQLKLHRERRNIPIYTLGKGKGAPKLEAADDGLAMSELMMFMQMVVDRPIIDKTGLDGKYKFVLLDFEGIRASNVSILTEVDEKFGLKLEPQNGPVEVLVVDSVQRPTSN